MRKRTLETTTHLSATRTRTLTVRRNNTGRGARLAITVKTLGTDDDGTCVVLTRKEARRVHDSIARWLVQQMRY